MLLLVALFIIVLAILLGITVHPLLFLIALAAALVFFLDRA